MFTSQIKHWRMVDKPLTAIHGENLVKEKKLYLFERAVNYVLTAQVSIKRLLDEILGFSDTRCAEFLKLSVDNSFFFPESINREITYLLIICYLKENIGIQDTQGVLEAKRIKVYFDNLFSSELKIRLSISYINEIQIKQQKISFRRFPYDKFSAIKLDKYVLSEGVFKYTNKINVLKLKDVFYNQIYGAGQGHCLGAVKYWLDWRAKSDKLSFDIRRINKNEFVKSLAVADGNLVNQDVCEYIEKAHNTMNSNFSLRYFRILDIYTSLTNFISHIGEFISIMRVNNFNYLYLMILTSSHALGLAISTQGLGYKFVFYDPDNKLLYSKIFMHENSLCLESYKLIYAGFEYLSNNNNQKLPLLIKIYTNEQDFKLLPTSKLLNIDINKDIFRQLYILAYENNDSDLMKQIINNGFNPNDI